MSTEFAVDLNSVPATFEGLARRLADPMWRLCSGQLYKILIKGDPLNEADGGTGEPEEGADPALHAEPRTAAPSSPAMAMASQCRTQGPATRLYNADLHLVARPRAVQPEQSCGIIAQDREAAEVIFRDKVKCAPSVTRDASRFAALRATRGCDAREDRIARTIARSHARRALATVD